MVPESVVGFLMKTSSWTPLHYAAFGGHKEIAELLIASDADMNVKDNWGRTPLDLAIQYNKPEISNLLRTHGGKTSEELKAAGKQSSSSSERSCAFHICIAFRN